MYTVVRNPEYGSQHYNEILREKGKFMLATKQRKKRKKMNVGCGTEYESYKICNVCPTLR